MFNLFRYSKGPLLLIILLLSASCAKVPIEAPPVLYWPLPPEKPRIKFLNLIMGSLDVTGVRTGKFEQALFGEAKDLLLFKPTYIAVNNNVVFVSDYKSVHMYDFNKKEFGLIGRDFFINATGIDVTSNGTVYVGDSARGKVFIFKRGATRIKSFGGGLVAPAGIKVDDKNNRIYVVDTKRHVVDIFTLDGELIFELGKRGTGAGEFNFPYDVEVDQEGKVYVLDSGNFRVQIFSPEWKFISQFGRVGTAPGHFSRPKSITLDSEGHIYVVDAGFGNFQIFDKNGNVFLAVGTGGKEPGMFMLPFGIAIDENDKIYVVDQVNRRVQIFQYLKYPEG